MAQGATGDGLESQGSSGKRMDLNLRGTSEAEAAGLAGRGQGGPERALEVGSALRRSKAKIQSRFLPEDTQTI